MTDPVGQRRRDLVSDVSACSSGPLLSLQVASSEGRSIVELTGEIDGYSAPRLRRCLRALTDAGDRRIVLDFKGIKFIDSAGLGVLIGATKCLSERSGELVVTRPRPQAAKLLEMTGVDTVLTVQKET
jgi:anti-sigma B factor antagonist